MNSTITVLGGDLRQVYLARMLLDDGHDVVTWGLDQGGAPGGVPLNTALERDILILPLPVCRGGRLNLPLTDTELHTAQLWPRLRYDQLLLGGMTKDLSPQLMADFGLTLLDYYDREETQVASAVPTAEGALQLAMESTDRTLLGSLCLVIGYGRIGRLLADRLLALGAAVTVSARKYGDLAWIDAWGCRSVRTNALTGQLDRYDLIFNTAPALILDGARLRETREDCVIIDLASAPGGVDLEEARRLGRQVIQAPGLPGKVAPRSAAAAVRDSVYHILEERGEPI
ncbi:MAG: dipicolinate synthase [Oscillospiraceae bacterium]|nr:dipicolinate synthase [Oscillospiraceae bacterium]